MAFVYRNGRMQYRVSFFLQISLYYYANICLKLNKQEELSSLLKDSLSYKIEEQDAIDFLYFLLYDYLIDGHFRDKKIIAAKTISKKILKKYNEGIGK